MYNITTLIVVDEVTNEQFKDQNIYRIVAILALFFVVTTGICY
jgi:hypothetical protein